MNLPPYLRGLVAARWTEMVCVLLLAAMAANMLTVIARKSITHDETFMIPAGYYHLVWHNLQYNVEHPPASKLIAAVPLLFLGLKSVQPSNPIAPEQDLARFWEDNRASFERIGFWARVPAILLTLVLGILIFVFARELFGARAGLIAVALFSLEPTVLAHGRVAGNDIPAALGYLLVVYTLYRYLKSPAWQRAAGLGLAAGFAFLTKFSMLVVGPLLAVLFLILAWRAPRDRHQRSAIAAHAGLAALASLLVVDAAYFFHTRPLADWDIEIIKGAFPRLGTVLWRLAVPFTAIMPTEFITGAFWQIEHNKVGHATSLLGMFSLTGWRYYFAVAFGLKVPLPFLILSIASLGWCAYKAVVQRNRACMLLVGAFAIYFAYCSLSSINIGIRYLLPAFPFLFIIAGAFLDRLMRSQRLRAAGMATAALIAGWIALEAVRAYPNHMSYMNQLASTRPAWEYLADSNVEWGDDVRELAEFLRARGETRVRASLLGDASLRYYGIEQLDLLDPVDGGQTKTRYVAIGAHFLGISSFLLDPLPSGATRVDPVDAYRSRQPEAIIGGSIYVFRDE